MVGHLKHVVTNDEKIITFNNIEHCLEFFVLMSATLNFSEQITDFGFTIILTNPWVYELNLFSKYHIMFSSMQIWAVIRASSIVSCAPEYMIGLESGVAATKPVSEYTGLVYLIISNFDSIAIFIECLHANFIFIHMPGILFST